MMYLTSYKTLCPSAPQMALSYDPNDNIWAYYPIIWVLSIMMEGLLIVSLSIPLIDKSLQMDPI